MRPKEKKVHTQKREKRFKFQHRAGFGRCMVCHPGGQWKSRRGTRPRRTTALKKGYYDEAFWCRFDGMNALHIKDEKSNRHHSGTRRRLMYRKAALYKHSLRRGRGSWMD